MNHWSRNKSYSEDTKLRDFKMTTVVENLKVVGSLGKPKWIKLP